LFSQVYKFQTTSVSLTFKNNKGIWDSWSKPKDASIIVTFDGNKNRIIVYSEIVQLFEIIEYIPEKSSKTEDKSIFICKNNDGEDCQISIITLKDQGNRKEMYIAYDEKLLIITLNL